MLAPRVECRSGRERTRRGRRAASRSLRRPAGGGARELLAGGASPSTLAAGEWLFEAGAPAAALYIVSRRDGSTSIVGDAVVTRARARRRSSGSSRVLAGGAALGGRARAPRQQSAAHRRGRISRGARRRAGRRSRRVTTALAAQLQRSRGIDDAAPAEPRRHRGARHLARTSMRLRRCSPTALAEHVTVVSPGPRRRSTGSTAPSARTIASLLVATSG